MSSWCRHFVIMFCTGCFLNFLPSYSAQASKGEHDLFNLAQHYQNNNEYALALDSYEKRVGMGGDPEEVFWSLVQMGRMQEKLKADPNIIISTYQKAYRYRPSRAEAHYYLSDYYRQAGDYQKSYEAALEGLKIPLPKDDVLVERSIYDYWLLWQLSVAAYKIGKFRESQDAALKLTSNKKVPQAIRDYEKRHILRYVRPGISIMEFARNKWGPPPWEEQAQ